jgi:flagellin-specific chaperone FliS
MLIEGAIRHGRKAEELLRCGDGHAAAASLLRVVDIVGEMLAGIREQTTVVNKKLTDLYWFLFRRVSEAKIHSDAAILAETLRLLEYERQTWLAVCEKLRADTTAGTEAISKKSRVPPASTPRFSLEA